MNRKGFLEPRKGRVIFSKSWKTLLSLWLIFLGFLYIFLGVVIYSHEISDPRSFLRLAFFSVGLISLIAIYGLLGEREWVIIPILISFSFVPLVLWITGAPITFYWPYLMGIVFLYLLWKKRKNDVK